MAERNTIQKEIIRHTLCAMDNHPTAAMVYEQVHQNHPAVSRSTVYRVLARMAEEGKILRLELGGSDSRYDGRLHPHDHVRCRSCGVVADIPAVAVELPMESAGFLLEDSTVVYRGLCPICRRKAEKKDSNAERRL